MSNAFAPLQQARPCPTLGRPVRLRVAPIDYSPAVLRMPFGFRLTTDTLPSGRLQAEWVQVPLGCIRLSPSCPCRVLHTFLAPSSQRGVAPAFGYRAPHPSARGTSTLLSNTLLSALKGSSTGTRISTVSFSARTSTRFASRRLERELCQFSPSSTPQTSSLALNTCCWNKI
jgi:hypothetical protein